MSDTDGEIPKEAYLTTSSPSSLGSLDSADATSLARISAHDASSNPPQRSKTAPPLPPPDDVERETAVGGDNTTSLSVLEPSPVLRRTASALSTGSSSGQTAREKKRLRFTPMSNGTGSSSEDDSTQMEYLGDANDLEDGLGRRRMKGKGVPRDQADYLKSDPGTPNLSETSVGL